MKLGIALAAALATILTSVLGCSSPDGKTPPAQEIDWGLDARKPIASSSRVTLTSDQIWEVTGDYMAVTLWAFVAEETARENPGDFHQTFFSEPDRECVDEQRNLLLVMPDPPIEDLLACGRESAARGRGNAWAGIGAAEREARARKSVGLLFWSIDPPSMMTVRMAVQRGLEVNVKTNPDFARFATRYDVCEILSQDHAGDLAALLTSRELAEAWMQAEQHIRECSNQVTASVFGMPQPSEEEMPGQEMPGHEHDGLPAHGHAEEPAAEDAVHEHIGMTASEHDENLKQETPDAN